MDEGTSRTVRMGFADSGEWSRASLTDRLARLRALLDEAELALSLAVTLPDGSVEQDEQVGIIAMRLRYLRPTALLPGLVTPSDPSA